MAALEWLKTGEHLYETGVSKGVLYPIQEDTTYSKGFAWNGLSAIKESSSGAESSPIWADNTKYLDMTSAEEFGATIEAYAYPDEWGECDGSKEATPGVYVGQQGRKVFGLSYQTLIGNDVKGNDYGYKIHLIYGCKATPTEKSYGTVSDDPDAMQMSWDVTTTPVTVEGFKPTSHITIDSTKVNAENLKKLENILYGASESEARLPLPDEVFTTLKTGLGV